MQWSTFRIPGDNQDRVGLVDGQTIRALPLGPRLIDLLGDDGEMLRSAAEVVRADPALVVALDAVELRPPIPAPPSFRDFLAFENHVGSGGRGIDPDWYELPVFYFSNPAAMIGPGEPVPIPPGCSRLDYELEVAIVVGLPGRDLDPSDAEASIAGYVILNDWSGRDLQMREMRQGLGPAKGKDFATSIGPFLVTPDELEPWHIDGKFDLEMTARVNGREYSRSRLSKVYWTFPEMMAYASRGTRLVTGDILASGTVAQDVLQNLRQSTGVTLIHGSSRVTRLYWKSKGLASLRIPSFQDPRYVPFGEMLIQ